MRLPENFLQQPFWELFTAHAQPRPDALLGFGFITGRPFITPREIRERYEAGHSGAPRAIVPMGIRHYVRNYVQDATGFVPDYDVISEFGFKSGSTEPNVCGHKIDPNWSRSRSMRMVETLVCGTAATTADGPVRKRAALLRRPADATEEQFAAGVRNFAQSAASQAGNAASRVSSYMASGSMREVYDCVDIPRIAGCRRHDVGARFRQASNALRNISRARHDVDTRSGSLAVQDPRLGKTRHRSKRNIPRALVGHLSVTLVARRGVGGGEIPPEICSPIAFNHPFRPKKRPVCDQPFREE